MADILEGFFEKYRENVGFISLVDGMDASDKIRQFIRWGSASVNTVRLNM